MNRVAVLLYGVVAYALTLVSLVWFAGFLIGFGVPNTVDGPATGSFASAVLVNLGLLALFALQHSVMARPGFKQRLTALIPAAAERSTYVLLSAVALLALVFLWQPMGVPIWTIESAVGQNVLYALYATGWVIVLLSTFLINHFDLFGLRQVYFYFRGQPYQPLAFKTPLFYKFVRHPLYVGWITLFWATPTMTLAHLVLAVGLTAYILAAIPFEERDLVDALGDDYARYRDRVPKLIPALRR